MALNDKGEWVDWQNTKVLQKAGVTDEEGNVLMLKRSANAHRRPSMWDMPGGSVDHNDYDDEHPHKVGILREMQEEVSLTGELLEPLTVDSWTYKRSVGTVLGIAIGHHVTVKGVKPKVTLSDEHVEYAWMRIEDALALEFGDDGELHKKILEKLR